MILERLLLIKDYSEIFCQSVGNAIKFSSHPVLLKAGMQDGVLKVQKLAWMRELVLFLKISYIYSPASSVEKNAIYKVPGYVYCKRYVDMLAGRFVSGKNWEKGTYRYN